MYGILGFEQSSRTSRKYVLVARGPQFGSHIIHSYSSSKPSSVLDAQYKIWIGVYGDEEGFERNITSVLKGFKAGRSLLRRSSAGGSSERSSVASSDRTARETSGVEESPAEEHQTRAGDKKRKRAGDRAAYQKADPSFRETPAQRTRVGPSSMRPTQGINAASLETRLARVEEAQSTRPFSRSQTPETQTTSPIEAESMARPITYQSRRLSANQPHRPSEDTAAMLPLAGTSRLSLSEPTQPFSCSTLAVHMLTNTILLFHESCGKIARSRLLKDCSTTVRLFGQARVAIIFQDSDFKALVRTYFTCFAWRPVTYHSNYSLQAVRIQGEEQTLYLAENEKQDWEDFLEVLKAAKCWETGGDGQARGSCTIELLKKK
jgi:hypothetical protein